MTASRSTSRRSRTAVRLHAIARRIFHLGCALVALLFGLCAATRSALGAPLDQAGLDQLQLHVDCLERCELGRLASRPACLQSCNTAPAAWNKNLDSVVNRRDYQLALIEFVDAGTLTKICYESGAVVPKGQCGGSNCLATHTAAQCADADADGLKAWQESLAGTSDSLAQRICTAGSQCNGFGEQCFYDAVVDVSYCKARSAVSAFHLEKVEENASEVVVNVVFDYSPVPPTILDVYVQFSGQSLTLTDSRALFAATSAGKSVEVRQPGDNLIRVTAYGLADSRVIRPGPIAELVFRRKTGDASTLQFSTVQSHREDAMAPSQGGHQIGLRQDSAWGTPVPLKSGADATQGHVLVHYDFESEQRPISESNVMSPVNLCPLLRLASGRSVLRDDCPVEPSVPAAGPSDPTYAAEKRKRDRWISQLDALQKGVTVTTRTVPGVTGLGSYFDGRNDHVEMPLTFNLPAAAGGDFTEARQSFSLAFWAFQEPAEVNGEEQVLYSRGAQTTEISQFALLSRANLATDSFDLLWLNGDVANPGAVRTVLKTGIPNRKWTHIGLSVDAPTRKPRVYVDGQPTTDVAALAAGGLVTCPQTVSGSLKRMTIHEEGDFSLTQGAGPETIFFSSAAGNGLFGIEAMDPNGLGRRTVLRLLDGSAKDPDYSPVVDRIVYSSNQSGDSEIWIAWADGSHAQRITQGFGSTADGMFARRPRWAPDASGIVFESNARDVDARDNLEGLGYHLYFIEYDPQRNEVAIPVVSDPTSKLAELNYDKLVGSRDIVMYRLTQAEVADNNMQPQWLAGGTGTEDLARGELAFTTTDANGANPRARRLRVAKTYMVADANKELLPFVGNSAFVTNRTLLAARAVRAAGQPVIERALLAEQRSESVTAPEFQVTVTAGGGSCASGSAFTAVIRYTNPAQPSCPDINNPLCACSDINKNRLCDASSEDKNRDGTCNLLDCNAAEFESIYLNYERAQAVPDMASVQVGTWVTTNEKRLRAVQVFGAKDSVRLELTSQVNNTPIPNGTELARIRFCGPTSPAAGFAFKKLVIKQRFFVVTSTDGVTPPPVEFVLADPRIQSITGAEFSPDAKRLALSMIFDARPMLMRTKDHLGTTGADMLTTDPVRVEGMSWGGTTRFYPCNWLGSVRHPTSKMYLAAFGGALDEVRLVDYVRTQSAFLSESERGHERLAKEGRDGAGPLGGTPCTDDATCDDGELCVSGTCRIVNCNPSVPYPCTRGRCQRLAVEVSPTEQYACVTECASDSTCQEQQCANGPCTFCDTAAGTCGECRRVVDNVGGLNLEYIQGCPDRNSFACDRGTCVSECYSFRNGETKYLCDPATEYCRAGRCTLFDWNWTDLSPVSLAGAGEMSSHGIPTTTAISQLYKVEFTALGSGDYAHPPELVVEAKATGVFSGNWFDIGRVVVDNETRSEAESKPYVLYTPYPITTLRFRNVVPPHENTTNTAMGLINGRAGAFCTAGTDCRLAAQGSRAWLGYESWIPGHLAKCKRDAGLCVAEHLRFLRPGVPTAILLKVMVKDQTLAQNTWENKICPYWDGSAAGTEPADVAGVPYHLVYGDAAREVSNQKRAYYDTAAATSLLTFNVVGKGFGLVNCNYLDDTGAVAAVAGVQIPVTGVSFNQLSELLTTETANSCTVNVGTPQAARYEACFEWGSADVSLDPFASEPLPYRTLTLARFKSFGWGSDGDDKP